MKRPSITVYFKKQHTKDEFQKAVEEDGFSSDTGLIRHLIREYMKNRATKK